MVVPRSNGICAPKILLNLLLAYNFPQSGALGLHWRWSALLVAQIPLGAGACFGLGLCPESPAWLMVKASTEKARSNLMW